MSLHSSLRVDTTQTKFRNVLKRHERIQRLIELEKWNDRPSAFGLPKVKSIRVKMKKVKEPKAEAAAGTAGTIAAATPAAATPAVGKTAAPSGKSPVAATAASTEKKKKAGEKK